MYCRLLDLKIRGAKVLVVVKAYPNPSKTYEETVCTAGLLDGRSWVRIYPVPFRFLSDESKFPKYAWIQLDLERRIGKDFRPESYRPLRGIQETITVQDQIPANERGWKERRDLLLQECDDSMTDLIERAYQEPPVSIAVLKPREITGVIAEPAPREWPNETDDGNIGPALFPDDERAVDRDRPQIKKIPFRFAYEFVTSEGKSSNLLIAGTWRFPRAQACYWRAGQPGARDAPRAGPSLERTHSG